LDALVRERCSFLALPRCPLRIGCLDAEFLGLSAQSLGAARGRFALESLA
jgi:uncharacterized protein YlaN (UPF0358 family)